MGNRLDKGELFPILSLGLVDGGTINLPNGFNTDDSVVLFYRGHW
jgi:hypothetical protein